MECSHVGLAKDLVDRRRYSRNDNGFGLHLQHLGVTHFRDRQVQCGSMRTLKVGTDPNEGHCG